MHGIYPRSAGLIAATRDVERRRTTPEEVAARRAEDAAAFVDRQRAAGVHLFSDGLLSWQDLFRPLIEASDGLEPAGLVRWFDTNSFYRAPVVSGEPVLRDPAAVTPRAETPRPCVGTLPSPLLFSRVAHGVDDSASGRDALMRALATRVLRPAAEHLAANGCALVHLEEPWIVSHPVEETSWAAFAEALADLGDGLGVPVALHTSFGDAGPVIDRLRHLPLDALGVDLVETDVGDLGHDWTVGLVAGAVDGRSSLVESVDATAKVVAAAAEHTGAAAVYLTSGTSFDLLPEPLAAAKLDVLGQAAARLRDGEVRP
ncbi:MAG TPA: hypothetical protein VKU86_12605 [Acidimicrobiales bacterium]|nr:hypothetical protein [Acidimicrobiales bacterium]